MQFRLLQRARLVHSKITVPFLLYVQRSAATDGFQSTATYNVLHRDSNMMWANDCSAKVA